MHIKSIKSVSQIYSMLGWINNKSYLIFLVLIPVVFYIKYMKIQSKHKLITCSIVRIFEPRLTYIQTFVITEHDDYHENSQCVDFPLPISCHYFSIIYLNNFEQTQYLLKKLLKLKLLTYSQASQTLRYLFCSCQSDTIFIEIKRS